MWTWQPGTTLAGMRTTLRTLLAVAVRVAAFVAGEWAFTTAYERAVPATPGDADLGEGLLLFLLMIGVALLWGAWDGFRRGFGLAAAVWVATGVLTGAALAIVLGLGDPANTLQTVVADLADTAPFLAGLVLVPALIMAAIGAIIRHAGTPNPRPV
jgi:uncharacterized membrane protein